MKETARYKFPVIKYMLHGYEMHTVENIVDSMYHFHTVTDGN